MKFYTEVTREPKSVIKCVRDGLNKVVSMKRLCVFVDGELETDNPDVIKELKARPDLFWVGREDVNYRTLAYPQLVYEAERLGISTYKVTKRDLMKALIHFERDKKKTSEVSEKVEEIKVKERVEAPKTIEKMKEEARQAIEKAKKNSELIASMGTIEEIGVGVKVTSDKGIMDEIEEIEKLKKEEVS